MEDWNKMLNFALDLVLESKISQAHTFIGERIIILHLDHAMELLMKAFLIKKGYIIEEIDNKKIKKNGIKEDTDIKTLINKDKTIGYLDCLDLVSKIVNFRKKDKIVRFHRIRNEIQHRATNLPLNKEEEISNFYPYFKELYGLMFPDFERTFPNITD